MENKIIQIAIDGPSGAGKSTLAKYLAGKLGILYLDTGAMYRSFAYHAEQNGVSGSDDAAIVKLFDSFHLDFDKSKVLLNGKDITAQIRTPHMDKKVSEYAVNPLIRKHLVEMQRNIWSKQSIVMEGRDIGSVVLKDAPYKFYIDANLDERAKRRYLQNLEKNPDADYEYIKNDIIRRDKVDSQRTDSPLCVPLGAHVIDTSNISVDEVAEIIIGLIKSEE